MKKYKKTVAGAAVCLFFGSTLAQSAPEIPAVPAYVMQNARVQAGAHPDVSEAAAMGMRPERRAASETRRTSGQVDLKDAVKQAVEDAQQSRQKETGSESKKQGPISESSNQTARHDAVELLGSGEGNAAKSVIVRSPVVNVLPGVNVVIPIARNQPNRLLTPFKHPQVLSTDLQGGKGDDCGEACVRGSVLYVSTDQAKPVTAFITERGREDIAISVTMIPERIAPRQVEFLLPKNVMEKLSITDVGAVEGSSNQARIWEQSQPYIVTLKESFKAIALGQVPQGFSLRNTKQNDKVPYCRQPGLSFDFKRGQVLEGHNLIVFVGVMKNESSDAIEFNETRCGNWNVAAVTSFPLKVLEKGQQTEVYVAVKREKKPAAGTVRRPLIDRQY